MDTKPTKQMHIQTKLSNLSDFSAENVSRVVWCHKCGMYSANLDGKCVRKGHTL